MRLAPTLLAAAVAALFALTGCSGEGRDSTVRPYLQGDEDADAGRFQDRDDYLVRGYGHEASAGQRSAVASVVRRYLTAAAAGNGAAACSLVSSRLANSSDLARVLQPADTPTPNSSALREKDCARAEALLFGQSHQQLSEEAPTVQVIGLRVEGDRGLALLGFGAIPEKQVAVVREAGRWKVDALLDVELP